MGRPPLNMQIVNVRLPKETVAKIDALVGPYRRPAFIREAVENAMRVAEMTGRFSTPKE